MNNNRLLALAILLIITAITWGFLFDVPREYPAIILALALIPATLAAKD
jgi:hypothetical protein